MKADKANSNPKPNPMKSIFLFKQRKTKINKKLNIYLFKKILCNSKISTLITKKSFHNLK